MPHPGRIFSHTSWRWRIVSVVKGVGDAWGGGDRVTGITCNSARVCYLIYGNNIPNMINLK